MRTFPTSPRRWHRLLIGLLLAAVLLKPVPGTDETMPVPGASTVSNDAVCDAADNTGQTPICSGVAGLVGVAAVGPIVAPTLMGCIRPGTYPLGWESGRLSPTGQYAWVYWVKRTCCVQL